MSLIDRILTILAPYNCLSCHKEGGLLCSACIERLPLPIDRCYRCHKLTPKATTCTACQKRSCLHSVRAASLYGGVTKELVWKLKSSGAQAAARQMAHCMLP